MKRLFWFGLVIGFAGTLAAAYLFPWVAYTRYASETTVVANGGRAERFIIRLPADRIESHRAGDGASASVPTLAPTYLDHYKLRDQSGNVIGIVARHATGGEPAATAWLVTIPSRGAVMLGGSSRTRDAIEAMLAERGWTRGQPWAGELLVPDAATARSVAATDEFAGLSVELAEIWTISGVGADGELRGTIELNTIGRRGS